MAINTHKQLHYHAVPIIIFAVGMIVVTTLMTTLVFKTDTAQPLTRLLSVRLYDVKPSSNGLAHISRHTEAAIGVPTDTANLEINDFGQSASLQAAVYSQ